MNDSSSQNSQWKAGNTTTLVLFLVNILAAVIWLIIFYEHYETVSKVIGAVWAAITAFLGYIKVKRQQTTLASFAELPPVKIFVIIYTILNISAFALFILWHTQIHTVVVTARLNGEAKQGASVYWNGTERGKTEADGSLKFSGVKGGNHNLLVKLPDGAERTMGDVFVWLTLTRQIHINFDETELPKGFLKIDITPKEIHVDIKNLDNHPLFEGLVTTPYIFDLPVGEYNVHFSKKDFETDRVSFRIQTEDTIAITKTLDCARGSIHITSDIAGADIYLNGKKLNKSTPQRLENLCVGTYSIQLIKQSVEFENYRAVATKSITVEAGVVHTIHFKETDFRTEEIG